MPTDKPVEHRHQLTWLEQQVILAVLRYPGAPWRGLETSMTLAPRRTVPARDALLAKGLLRTSEVIRADTLGRKCSRTIYTCTIPDDPLVRAIQAWLDSDRTTPPPVDPPPRRDSRLQVVRSQGLGMTDEERVLECVLRNPMRPWSTIRIHAGRNPIVATRVKNELCLAADPNRPTTSTMFNIEIHKLDNLDRYQRRVFLVVNESNTLVQKLRREFGLWAPSLDDETRTAFSKTPFGKLIAHLIQPPTPSAPIEAETLPVALTPRVELKPVESLEESPKAIRSRLRELLSIPYTDRSKHEWSEIDRLEALEGALTMPVVAEPFTPGTISRASSVLPGTLAARWMAQASEVDRTTKPPVGGFLSQLRASGSADASPSDGSWPSDQVRCVEIADADTVHAQERDESVDEIALSGWTPWSVEVSE